MAKREWTIWHSVRDECVNYSYAIIDNMVVVRANNGHKATQIGGSPPLHIARILARELGALNRCADC